MRIALFTVVGLICLFWDGHAMMGIILLSAALISDKLSSVVYWLKNVMAAINELNNKFP